MSINQPYGPPPGWYPDPGRPTMLRWWDGRTWTGYAQSLSLVAFPPNPQGDLAAEASAARLAKVALAVGAAVYIAEFLLIAFTFKHFWHDVRVSIDDAQYDSEGYSFDGTSSSLFWILRLASLLQLAVVGGFVFWLYRAAVFAQRAGLPARRSPGWAIAGIFVPIVNFWFPYQSAADLFPPSDPERRIAGWWWTFYLLQAFAVVPVLIVAAFSTVAAVIVAIVACCVPILTALAGRRLIDSVATAHQRFVR